MAILFPKITFTDLQYKVTTETPRFSCISETRTFYGNQALDENQNRQIFTTLKYVHLTSATLLATESLQKIGNLLRSESLRSVRFEKAILRADKETDIS